MNLLARAMITLVALVTLIGSNIADWNHTHIFSELRSPHAHLHGAWFDIAISLLSMLSIWLLWSPGEQPRGSAIAAVVQACIWVAFFPAMLVPDTALADPGRAIAPIFGIDLNLYGAGAHVALLALALVLLHKGPARSRT